MTTALFSNVLYYFTSNLFVEKTLLLLSTVLKCLCFMEVVMRKDHMFCLPNITGGACTRNLGTTPRDPWA